MVLCIACSNAPRSLIGKLPTGVQGRLTVPEIQMVTVYVPGGSVGPPGDDGLQSRPQTVPAAQQTSGLPQATGVSAGQGSLQLPCPQILPGAQQ